MTFDMTKELTARLDLAVTVAREAGDITLAHFRGEALAVELKQDASPVTIADRRAEEHLRSRIAAAFPADGVLGEEFGERVGTSGFRWILDPIDGTKSFVAGVPLYGELVAVEHEGRAVVGVIHIPAMDEMVYAARGQGAWHRVGAGERRPAKVSTKARLDESLFLTTDPKTFTVIGRRDAYEALEQACKLARTWGDCYGYLMVATGRAEVMVDPKMHVWDCAALQPVLEEAGGTFTDWRGTPTIHAEEAVATNGLVRDEVLRILASR